MKLYFSIVFFILSNLSSACSCMPKKAMEKALDETNVVVSGKVLSKEAFSKKDGKLPKHFSDVKYKILVTKVHKGKLDKKIITIVTGPAMGGDCGYFFQIGMTYTLYANYLPIEIGGKKVDFLQTNTCTRTAKFSKVESSKIESYCKSKGYS